MTGAELHEWPWDRMDEVFLRMLGDKANLGTPQPQSDSPALFSGPFSFLIGILISRLRKPRWKTIQARKPAHSCSQINVALHSCCLSTSSLLPHLRSLSSPGEGSSVNLIRTEATLHCIWLEREPRESRTTFVIAQRQKSNLQCVVLMGRWGWKKVWELEAWRTERFNLI